LNSLSRHQASNSVQADDFALVEQILVHSWRSNHAPAVLVNLPNALHQARILLSSRTWFTILPGVIAAGRNLQATAHQSYRVLVAAALAPRVPPVHSFAKFAGASLTQSRSLLPPANSRLSRAGSSSRGLPVPGKTFAAPGCVSRTRRASRLGATPISRASCR